MKKKQKSALKDKWIYINRYYLLAFFLPFIAFLIAYIAMGIYPFGDREVQIIDSYHQYAPFFAEYYDKLRHGGSLLFSWKGSLGINFWAIIAYYLTSPLNLLLLLFPRKLLLEGFALILMIKVGLSGWSFSYYISKHFKRYDLSIVFFSMFYALSGWMIGYNWNIMWLDCIMLFPLVMLGMERLMKTGSGKLYTIMLGLCIFCNYYIAIMICIFLVIDFFVLFIQGRDHSFKNFLGKGLRFAGCSILGGCMSMIMVLPELFALLQTHSAESSFPTKWEIYDNFLDIMSQHMAFIKPTDLSGLPNLYCGIAALLLFVLYLMRKKTPIRKKLTNLFLLVLLIFSCNVNVLDYVWHGFHYPNSLPNRFTFIYIFILLVICYEVWIALDRYASIQYMIAFIVSMAFVAISYLYGKETHDLYVYIIAMALIWVYFMILVLYKNMPRFRVVLAVIFCAFLVAESMSNAVYGLMENGSIDRVAYMKKVDAGKVVREAVGDDGEDQLYRTELNELHGRNNAMWLGFKSMSLFSSTLSDGLDHLVDQMGFFAATNKFSYEGSTRFTDNILAIRYLLADLYQSNIRGFEYLQNADDYFLYENPDVLSIGFMVKPDYENWEIESSYPWHVLNDFAYRTTGIEEELFEEEYISGEPEVEGGEINRQDNYTHYLEKTDGSDGTTAVYHLNLDYNAERYIYFVASHMKNLKVDINGHTTTYLDTRGHIVDLGYCGPEDEITLTYKLSSDHRGGDILMNMFSLDQMVYEEVMEALSDEQLQVTAYGDTVVHGNIDVKEDGILFTSIPYDRGWSVYVDGKKVETYSLSDSLMYIRLSKGQHVIKMKYLPAGFVAGAGITILAIFIYILVFCWKKDKCRLYKVKKDQS